MSELMMHIPVCEACRERFTAGHRYCSECRDLEAYFAEREPRCFGRASFDMLPRTDAGVMEIPPRVELVAQVMGLVITLVIVCGFLGLAAIGAVDVVHRLVR